MKKALNNLIIVLGIALTLAFISGCGQSIEVAYQPCSLFMNGVNYSCQCTLPPSEVTQYDNCQVVQ